MMITRMMMVMMVMTKMVMICVEGRNLCVTLEGSGRSVGCCKAGKCCKGGDFKDGGEN